MSFDRQHPEPRSTRSPENDAALEQAIAWAVRFGGSTLRDDERIAFDAWRRSNDANERAWHEVQQLHEDFEPLAGAGREIAYATLTATRDDTEKRTRRRMLGAGLAAVGMVVVGGSGWRAASTRLQYETGEGQRERHVLDDGTTLHLNTRTAVSLVFTPLARELAVHRGEILVVTGEDRRGPLGHRSFRVMTPQARLTALGTRFDVRVDRHHTRVAVSEGRVAMQTLAKSEPVIAGPDRSFDIDRTIVPVVTGFDASGWTDGALVARNMRLDAFLDEFARYTDTRISVAPDTAGMRVSGVFQLDGPAAARRMVDALTRSMDLRASDPDRDGLILIAKR